MGLAELNTSQHLVDAEHPSVPKFELFQDFISHVGLIYNIDGIVSGLLHQPNVYLFPINQGVSLNEFQMENLVTEIDAHAFRHPITLTFTPHTYNQQGEFLFPRFTVLSDDKKSNLSAVIYPSKYYADQVKEADTLTFEIHRATSKDKRKKIALKIGKLRKHFPPISISKSRLLELNHDKK